MDVRKGKRLLFLFISTRKNAWTSVAVRADERLGERFLRAKQYLSSFSQHYALRRVRPSGESIRRNSGQTEIR